ncbi:leucine rich repeat containing 51 isoform X3 [Gadus chalcogrammus]|uniref:leucine rich repeat containing 51 isoform X3 n=1 Tax=Gadus chalcogrammus TaxID=1042646 RepID=UPI0024C481B7|nr:leucine rich repeat containing 51 isoform X3 [Gadus chalcogrammus]
MYGAPLDLSFRCIKSLSDTLTEEPGRGQRPLKRNHENKYVLCELGELRVLYLHGNSICNSSEVDRLVKLPFLHTITLHGNLIEGDKGYRCRVISALAKLKMMDFSAVTPQDRSMANIWFQRNSCGKCKIKDVK